jgi:hypothetical protein
MRQLTSLLTLLLLVILAPVSQAQSPTEGMIEMGTEMINMPEEYKQFASMMPKGSTMYFKGDKIRTETQVMGMSMAVINDANGTVQLMELGGKKYAIRTPNSAETENPGAKIELVDESREIAGYKCKRANVTVMIDGKPQVMIMFYTTELKFDKATFDRLPKGLKLPGYPMSIEFKMEQMGMRMEVKKVTPQPVPDSMFQIPEGYTETTTEQLKNEMGIDLGGMMGGRMGGSRPGGR